jgi:flagellin-specific chaperone FliS|tara:strand:- start:688 stop:999 length:312 start_codon:yes stop_codon:yes gene_type:complete
MSVEIKKDDLEDLEESMYDCWNITTDIAKILDISDNIEDDVRALIKVYNVKFKFLASAVDDVDHNLTNLRETWEEMRPDRFAENEDKSDKDLFGNVVLGEDGC